MSAATAAGSAPAPASALTGEPQWLAVGPEPVYAVLHTPPAGARTGLAALILPPFGWDNECSYRRRREWARQLAGAGITAAGFDFPGSEDSAGSPLAANRAESWVSATLDTARWLRERSGCLRLVAVGIGLGGLIACEALTRGAPIDDLVLWGVRGSGRAYLRELRAYAAVTAPERTDGGDDLDAKRADGAIGIGGHIMSAETVATLSAIELTKLTLPDAGRRRVLMIGRDTHGVDPELSGHLREQGVDVSTVESDEYKGLMSPPDLDLIPTRAIAASIDWMLAARATPTHSSARSADRRPGAPPRAVAATLDTVQLEQQGVSISERVLQLDTPAGRLVGVLSEPAGGIRAPYCLVTVNSGALRHTGPNRLFVEIGRRAAVAGVPAARFDLPGLGDSDGFAVKSFDRTADDEPDSLAAIGAIYDHLQRIGVAERFVAAGFSLGGYLTVRMALAESQMPPTDRRLVGAVSVNPTGFSWTVKQRNRAIRDFTAMVGPDALTAEHARVVAGSSTPARDSRIGQLRRSVEARTRGRLARSDRLWSIEHRREIADLRRGLDQLRYSGTRVLLLLSENEPLLRMLELPRLRARLASASNVEVERLPDHDHLLRQLWIQDLLVERITKVLAEFEPPPERPPHQRLSSRSSNEVINATRSTSDLTRAARVAPGVAARGPADRDRNTGGIRT